jgi:hypothetical protein
VALKRSRLNFVRKRATSSWSSFGSSSENEKNGVASMMFGFARSPKKW